MEKKILKRILLIPENCYNKKNDRKVSNFVPRLDNRNKSPFHSLINSGYRISSYSCRGYSFLEW